MKLQTEKTYLETKVSINIFLFLEPKHIPKLLEKKTEQGTGKKEKEQEKGSRDRRQGTGDKRQQGGKIEKAQEKRKKE